MKTIYFKNLLTFLALMEADDDFLNKSPDYIMEKFERYVLYASSDEYNWGVHPTLKLRIASYFKRWSIPYEIIEKVGSVSEVEVKSEFDREVRYE